MSNEEVKARTLRVAAVGCSHGELDAIYRTIAAKEARLGMTVDLLLCCGDFQAMRNAGDLEYFACPPKYRRLADFHRYYSGNKIAPVLTIMIGGNHESSAFLQELPLGGWLAPNIYYLGFASVVNFGGLRICGWSGIYKQNDYDFIAQPSFSAHFESPPFERGSERSCYHVRSVEHFRLSLLAENQPNDLDVLMTHDWPCGITKHGDERTLLRKKPYFTQDVKAQALGNPHSMDILHRLRPRRWFAGHLHVKFAATVPHEATSERTASQTDFLALHKCVPAWPNNEDFIDVVSIDVTSEMTADLRYDPRWLAILRKTSLLEVVVQSRARIPPNRELYMPNEEDIARVQELFGGDFLIPVNFRQTGPPSALFKPQPNNKATLYYRNPQTKAFCDRLQIPDLNEELCKRNMLVVGHPHYVDADAAAAPQEADTQEIALDDDDLFGDDDFIVDTAPAKKIKLDE